MATLTLTTPITVGDAVHSITINKLNLASIAINFATEPAAVTSILMTDPVSGYSTAFTLTAADAQTFWTNLQTMFPNLQKQVLQLFQDSGKLPAGIIS